VSAANAGIGIGAIVGGMTIANLGIEYLGYAAAAIAVMALMLVPLVHKLASRQERVPAT